MKKIAIYTTLICLLSILGACNKAQPAELTEGQEIYFERSYINNAWVHQHSGFLIDKDGQIRLFSQPVNWHFPNEDSRVTDNEILENMQQTEIVASYRIEMDILKQYAKKIASVRENDYTEYQAMADAGASINACYLYDKKTQTYKQIVLSQTGDWVRINNHPVAKEIDEWLRYVSPYVLDMQ